MSPRKSKSSLGATAKVNVSKEVKAIARERVGAVKPQRVIVPKNLRKKPKHKKSPAAEE